MTFKWTVAAVSIAACVVTTGCVSRSHADVTVTGTTTISKGQELSDLQRALEAGAISQADYENVRAKILKLDN
jgi:outer membrane murein-binding lipoprotein Lpp